MKTIAYISCLLLLARPFGACAQDVHLSQFYEAPLLRNPALAGIFTGDIRLQFSQRNQWGYSGYPYRTTAVSSEYKFRIGYQGDYLTAGMQLLYDVAGSSQLKTLQVMPVVNFHKSLHPGRNEYLSIGFCGGFTQRRFDASNLTFDYQYVNGNFDPGAPTGETFTGLNRSLLDLGAGICYSNQLGDNGNYYIGMSLMHINQPNASFKENRAVLPVKMQLNSGIHLDLNETVSLLTELNFSRQGTYNETIFGGLLLYQLAATQNGQDKEIGIGAGALLRIKDAVVPVVKLHYGRLETGISYDVNISRLSAASKYKGGWELTLAYKLLTPATAGLQQLHCPAF